MISLGRSPFDRPEGSCPQLYITLRSGNYAKFSTSDVLPETSRRLSSLRLDLRKFKHYVQHTFAIPTRDSSYLTGSLRIGCGFTLALGDLEQSARQDISYLIFTLTAHIFEVSPSLLSGHKKAIPASYPILSAYPQRYVLILINIHESQDHQAEKNHNPF